MEPPLRYPPSGIGLLIYTLGVAAVGTDHALQGIRGSRALTGARMVAAVVKFPLW